MEDIIAPKTDQSSEEKSKEEEDKAKEEEEEIPELEQVEENELIEVKINNQLEDKSSIFSQKNESESSIF